MAIVDLIMPKMGESIMEATILKWLKNVGDFVKMDETILEIATDKVDSEVPSTAEGVIEELLFNVNDVVPVDTVIARIRTAGGDEADEVSAPKEAAEVVVDAEPEEQIAEVVVDDTEKTEVTGGGTMAKFYSPLVLNIAASEGIPLGELEGIAGTGNEGRVTKKDILAYVANRQKGGAATQSPVQVQQQPMVKKAEPVPETLQVGSYGGGNVEIIEMDRMRKLIADHMVRSKQTSPHVTSFSEADVTNMVLWREKVKNKFEKREGAKLTFTPLIIEALVKCIKKFPLINSMVDGDKIVIKKDINIGMATALANGNLIVPVIKNADQLNLVGLAKQVSNLAINARTGKLKADDTQGGTFTFTNVGTFGSLMGTPIINQPQVAIIAAGIIKKRPVVIETEQGDSIAIRHMMYLSMSYDHRIIDGSLGATFVTAVATELENFVGVEF